MAKNVWNTGTGSAKHGDLADLNADDHPQYLRTDGTRIITGNFDLDAFGLILDNNLLDEVRDVLEGVRFTGASDTALVTEAAFATGLARCQFMQNNISTNVNFALFPSATQYTTWNTGTQQNILGAPFATAANTGYTINEDGTYIAMCHLFLTASVNRSNIGMQMALDGAGFGPLSANDYIRNNGGHNESSVTVISTPFAATAGQELQVLTSRMAAAGTVTSPANSAYFAVAKLR